MNETTDPTSGGTSPAQSYAGANPILQALLAAMSPNTAGNDSMSSIQGLIGQLESSDPTLALIARYLIAQQEAAQHAAAPAGAGIKEPFFAQGGQQNFPPSVEDLQMQIMNLHADLEYLWERNDCLALALGACYLCWGENPACEVCAGKGRPGSTRPEKQMFSRWVMPAIRTMKAVKEVYAGNSNQIR